MLLGCSELLLAVKNKIKLPLSFFQVLVHCYAVARVFKLVAWAWLGSCLLVQINRTHPKIWWPIARMLLLYVFEFFVHCYVVAKVLLSDYLLAQVLGKAPTFVFLAN